MREIRLYGSEGGGAACSPYPYPGRLRHSRRKCTPQIHAKVGIGLPKADLDSRAGFPGLLSAGMTSAGVAFFRGSDADLGSGYPG